MRRDGGRRNAPARVRRDPERFRLRGNTHGGRSILVVLGLVEFQQKLHVLKAGVDMANEFGLHVIQPLVGVHEGRNGTDYRHAWEHDGNGYGEDLGISQLNFSSRDSVPVCSL